MPTPHIRFDRPAGPAFMRSIGLVPDPWQTDVLDGNHRRLLLNCSRQAGKSTAVAMLALQWLALHRDEVRKRWR